VSKRGASAFFSRNVARQIEKRRAGSVRSSKSGAPMIGVAWRNSTQFWSPASDCALMSLSPRSSRLSRFDDACAEQAAIETDRRRRLKERRREYERQAAPATVAVAARTAEVDQFEHDFQDGDSEAVAQFCTLVLDSSTYPEGFPHRTRVLYRPEPKEVLVEFELPRSR
jgi:hypothetical protein